MKLITLKKRFKNIALLNGINAKLKCWKTKRSYRVTTRYYDPLSLSVRSFHAPQSTSHDEWRSGLRRPRIFFLGTDEQQDKSGLIQSLQRIGEVKLFTRDDGTYGQNDPAPYADRRLRNTRRLWLLISDLA